MFVIIVLIIKEFVSGGNWKLCSLKPILQCFLTTRFREWMIRLEHLSIAPPP